MTPEQMTQVFRAGADAALLRSETASESAHSVRLAVVLGAMADAAERIAAGTAVTEPRQPAADLVADQVATGVAFGKAIEAIVRDLGHDPDDERVQAIVTRRIYEAGQEAA